MASIEKSYEGLQDLILREQITFICNRDLDYSYANESQNHWSKQVS